MITVSLPIFLVLCGIAIAWTLIDWVRGLARRAEQRDARRARERTARYESTKRLGDVKPLDD